MEQIMMLAYLMYSFRQKQWSY